MLQFKRLHNESLFNEYLSDFSVDVQYDPVIMSLYSMLMKGVKASLLDEFTFNLSDADAAQIVSYLHLDPLSDAMYARYVTVENVRTMDDFIKCRIYPSRYYATTEWSETPSESRIKLSRSLDNLWLVYRTHFISVAAARSAIMKFIQVN